MPSLRHRDLFPAGFFLRRAQDVAMALRLISYEIIGSLAGETHYKKFQ